MVLKGQKTLCRGFRFMWQRGFFFFPFSLFFWETNMENNTGKNKTVVAKLALLTEVTIRTLNASCSIICGREKTWHWESSCKTIWKTRTNYWGEECQWFTHKLEKAAGLLLTALRTGWCVGISLALAQLVLILFPETVSSWKEIPASLLIHLPHIWLLWRK